jgi:uncharacterized protein (TIGR02300 family)
MITNLKARGTKRICQSEDCGLPFYDLNRTEISCPSCGTAFDTKRVIHPRNAAPATPSWKRSRGFQGATVAPVAEAAEATEEEVEVEADEAADDTDDNAGALILEVEDEDEEVGGVIKPPVDDRGDV